MRRFPFVTVDVFTDRAFGGNPLAVFLDGRGLSDAEMQQVAVEVNYSETTFVLPPADPANTARVRIFTPAEELPFAGHPNVGTGVVLADRATVAADGRELLRFEEAAGLVEVEILRGPGGAVAGARLTAPQPFAGGAPLPVADVAACLGLPPGEVDLAAHPPATASVGLPFVVARLRSLAALGRCLPDPAAFARATEAHRATVPRFFVLAYVPTPGDAAHDVRARMFAAGGGIAEDPATGSAACALVALLASLDPAPEATLELRIGQGHEMGRPSLLLARAEKTGGRVGRVQVGGGAVPMLRGELALP